MNHRRTPPPNVRHSPEPGAAAGYSVGEIAEATGIAQATLRMWERRYGYPVPVRLPSGHRRYTEEQLIRLRRIAEAMARGHRVGSLLGASNEEIERLLDATRPATPTTTRLAEWLDHVRGMRGSDLSAALRAAAADRAPLAFLEEELLPLLREIGRAWADGRMEVRHEHLATQIVQDVLRAVREDLASRSSSKRSGLLLLTTLPGEFHGLGLQMAALLAEDAGVDYRSLGVDTPVGEIAGAARELAVDAVGISVSLAAGGVETDRLLALLRAQLPAEVALIAGGEGARRPRRGTRGVLYLDTLTAFDAWLRSGDWMRRSPNPPARTTS